ncbi:MAG: hypothetical protein R8K54_04880 [Mariprofundaceae bacterium]
MHIGSRLFAGISFLMTAALNNTVTVALIQLTLFILILINLEQGYFTLQKSAKLLRWLIIPIVLLHALFTPGELIITGMAIPVSIEGLKSGLWFAFHLTVIFFSAIVFSRLLTNREWIRSVLKLPFIGVKVLPYALLLERGWSRIKTMLQDEYAAWKEHEKGMRSFALHLASLPVKALKQSSVHADELWNNWDHDVSDILAEDSIGKVSVFSTITALTSGVFLWYACLSGGV